MLHDVQRILGIAIEGSLPAEPSEAEWQVGIKNLFGQPMSELRRRGTFTSGCVNVAELMQLCHRSQAIDTQSTTYYMAIIGSTLLADKTRTRMRPHTIFAVNADQDEIAWGAVTLAYLYWQLGMASRAGCKTIVGCLTLLQTWIYEYFPAFCPHPCRADEPNKTRTEMWSTKKPCREVDRLRECRCILDSMTETQAWSRFPFSARIGEHALCWACVPSEVEPSYVDWFSVCLHPFIVPSEGPTAGPRRTESRSEYFLNEWPSRFAPLARLPPVVEMNPRQRHALDVYLNDCKD
ncbi:protein MAINTENANCE OF MERISTEMS-like [Amaranthus tricolor]|uniref:protein MAINTENANCE OF MERISTEMS-like n=1 Tax=Amaranthus tricolor TaxID=29722 RepID=UPI002583231F|nr:protein MAINTENANCE OF MERISTEMS-like [Amaranthus tricolor]